MEISEQEKQRLRNDGFLIDDIIKVSEKIEELELGENLKKQWDDLLIPLRKWQK